MENRVNFEALLLSLLANLSEREQSILKQRYHLTRDLDKKATLKQIGDVYAITRERVRQIEREAIRKLLELRTASEYADQLKVLESEVSAYLEQQGGFVREDYLLNDFAAKNYQLHDLNNNSFIFVLDNLVDSVERIQNHGHFHASWKLSDIELDQIIKLIESLEIKLAAGGNLLKEDELLNVSGEQVSADLKNVLDQYAQKHNLALEDFLRSYLQATNRLEKNILGQWGVANWDKISPKKLADKILLIFEKETKPLHFREIAEKINEAKFDHKTICPATVHNELIANDNYVLIGRGIYALKDWGYTTGTVADIIEQVLRDAGKPMSKSEIFDAVLKQRQVNKSTIYLTLINKGQFVKNEGGEFILSK